MIAHFRSAARVLASFLLLLLLLLLLLKQCHHPLLDDCLPQPR
jgi:hypothetical protein